ncbi:MAG: PAS-domain containing protein [Rhodospirillaceae bacterium]
MTFPALTERLPELSAAAAGFLAAAVLFTAAGMRRAAALRRRAKARAVETARLSGILAQAKDGALVLVHEAEVADPAECTVACSRRLAVLLDLPQGERAAFFDVMAALAPPDAEALAAPIAALLQTGDTFDRTVAAPGCGRTLRLTGVRADETPGTRITSVIWFSDVTRETAAQEEAQRDIHTLRRDRSRYRAALDALPLPIWLRNDDLDITFCNTAFARAVGAPDPISARREGAELLRGAAGREGRDLAARAQAAGDSRQEREVLALGGTLRHLDVRETPLMPHGASAVTPAEAKVLGGTVGIALDTTEQQDSRAELARHDEAHALVLERLGTAIAVFDGGQRLRFYNTAFVRLWQLDDAWLDSEPDYGTVLEVLRDRRQLPEVADFPAYKAAEIAAFTDLLEPVEALMHLPGGTTLRRVVAPHPLGGLLLTYEDVTDTLALERSYNTLIDVQAETLNHLREAVAVFDAGGTLRLSNAAFAALWELPEIRPLPGGAEASDAALRFTEVVDLQARLIAEAAERRDFTARMARLFHDRDAAEGVLAHASRGTVRWRSAPLADGGAVLSYDAAADIPTDGCGSLAPVLAGGVRSIAGWSEVLAYAHYGALNPRQQAYIDSIRDAAAAMERLLVATDELQGGGDPEPPETLDVHAALSDALAAARERANRREVDLHFDCQPAIGAERLSLDAFERLLGMALDMALAGCSPGDAISLAAQREPGGGLTLTIADTGTGWDVSPGGDRAAEARFAAIRSYAALQGWRFSLVTVPNEGTAVTLRRERT